MKIRHGCPILYASNVLSILDSGQKRIESHSALVFQCFGVNQRDSVVVRASASQSVDLEFIPLVESYQQTLQNGIHSFPAWRSAFMGCCGEQAGKFVCCVVGQGTYRDGPSLCGRQVPQTPRKKQLPSECGNNIQKHSDTIYFLVNGG